MKTIAVFGGTFNPFHIGHYEMLKAICELDYIGTVLVMPDKIPPHKDMDFCVSDDDRIEMCRLVCEDFDKARLSTIEFERAGISYTADTVKILKNRYPDTDFYFVIGGDMVTSLENWYNTEYLFNNLKFIAFSRDDNNAFKKSVKSLTAKGVKITVINKAITDISSSNLRKNINIKYLPQKVYGYIKEKGLYNG